MLYALTAMIKLILTAEKARAEAAKAKAEEQKKIADEIAKDKQTRQAEQDKAQAAFTAATEAVAIAAVSDEIQFIFSKSVLKKQGG